MKNDILDLINERDLHPVLNIFCIKCLDIKVKTIYHEKSSKNKGKSEWLHPDMVGFQLTISNWNNNVIDVCKEFNISKAILYSFELKKSITIDTLREYYFQAVSNSSWSNEGYLVTAELDADNLELMSELKRLNGAFGIGIIKLDVLNPENSMIILQSKRKDSLDGETMNRLNDINPDYKDYIEDISKSLQINRIVCREWDDLNEYDKLLKKIEKLSLVENTNKDNDFKITEKELNVINNTCDDNTSNNKDYCKKVNLSSKDIVLTRTKPIECLINNKSYKSTTWKNLLINIVIDLKESSILNYNNYISKTTFLSLNKNKYKESVYIKELDLYSRPLSANDCYKELQFILNSFEIDLNKCYIIYSENK